MFARDLLPIPFPTMLPIAGYSIGDLDIEAFRYNGGVSAGNLSVTGTYFATRAGTTSYTWDTRGRLTGATTIDTSSRVIAQTAYQYDVFDRRIGRTENIEGVIVDRDRYLYQGEHVTAVASDSDGDGNYRITDRYLHSMTTDAVLSMISSAESTAASLNVPTTATLASADLLWTLTDHLGSVRDVVSANGDIVRHHVNYDAFGNRVGEVHRDTSGNLISADNTAAIDALFGYAGREWDDAIDLQYNRARWYDPNTGRWISQDPIGFEAGDANLMRYVGNDPMNATDPSGLEIVTGPVVPGGEPLNPGDLPWVGADEIVIPMPSDSNRNGPWIGQGTGELLRAPDECTANYTGLLWDFLTGGGENFRKYHPSSPILADFKDSPGVTAMRNEFYDGGFKDIEGFSDGTVRAAFEAGPFTPSYWWDVEFQVGGFGGATATNNGNGTVTFRIRNVAGRKSFLYHAVGNRESSDGCMRSIVQVFEWTERIPQQQAVVLPQGFFPPNPTGADFPWIKPDDIKIDGSGQ